MRVEVYDMDAVPEWLDVQADRLREQAWPSRTSAASDAAGRHDRALDPQAAILIDGERVIATLDILTKDITHLGNTFCARGISALVTDQQMRGLGHGHHLVTAARELIANSGADLGIFTCDRRLLPFYESAGWLLLPGTVLIGGTVANPFPSDQDGFDKVTVADFFSPHATEHRGTFEHTRIGLYPGEIDKLW